MGTQGWSYDDWNGRFYPPGVKASDRLEVYARAFDTVEVDSTFYALPPLERFVSWRDRTPDGFMMAMKLPGEVTHEARLRDPRPASRFCDAARRLGPRLGPILIQLPPDFSPRDFDVVSAFLQELPDDLRFAVEFRDSRWLTPRTFRLLEDRGIALALSMGPWLDEAAAREAAERAPGRLLYLRWMGTPAAGRDPGALVEARDRETRSWAGHIPRLDKDEVFAFYSNDYQGHSPASARRLQAFLGQQPVAPRDLSPQRDLFG